MTSVTIEHHLHVIAAIQENFPKEQAAAYGLLYRWGVIYLMRTTPLEELTNEQFLLKEAALLAMAYEETENTTDGDAEEWPRFEGFLEAKFAFLEILSFSVPKLYEAIFHEGIAIEAAKNLDEELKRL